MFYFFNKFRREMTILCQYVNYYVCQAFLWLSSRWSKAKYQKKGNIIKFYKIIDCDYLHTCDCYFLHEACYLCFFKIYDKIVLETDESSVFRCRKESGTFRIPRNTISRNTNSVRSQNLTAYGICGVLKSHEVRN